MKILDHRIWVYIECDCGNKVNLTEFVTETHCDKCGKIYSWKVGQKSEVTEGWLPTAENINALPEPVRKYIHDLVANCDPAGMVQENVLLKENCKALEIKLEEKLIVTKEFIGKVVARIYCDRKSAKAIKAHLQESYEKIGIRIVTSGRNQD